MQRSGVAPNTNCYNYAMMACVRSRMLDHVTELVKEMEEAGVSKHTQRWTKLGRNGNLTCVSVCVYVRTVATEDFHDLWCGYQCR